MSAPAENDGPSPDSTTARESPTSANAVASSSINAASKALRRSGRAIAIRRTPALRSILNAVKAPDPKSLRPGHGSLRADHGSRMVAVQDRDNGIERGSDHETGNAGGRRAVGGRAGECHIRGGDERGGSQRPGVVQRDDVIRLRLRLA